MRNESRKRKQFSVRDKLDAVDRIKSGVQQTQVARDLGINESTVRGWKKDESKLRNMVAEVEESFGLKRKRARLAADTGLDAALYQWFVQARQEGVPLSGTLIKAQAQKFDMEMNGTDSEFKASGGWLDRFKKRHGISQIKVSGEIRSSDASAASDYPDRLREIIEEGGYVPEQLYNCDETGLCFRMMPDKTLAAKDDEHKHEGFKQAKDRVTILFCVNKTGTHKMKPLCIGKSKKPRCFHHINMETLPLTYVNSKKAWMTSILFDNWFHKDFVPAVRSHLRKLKLQPKALLLLDNCPAHPPAETLVSRCKKIRVSYLPKNTTSRIQPLDQGIISVFKTNYRRELVKKLLSTDSPIQHTLRNVTIKEMMYLAGQAWDAVTATCIDHCWMHGLGDAFPTAAESCDSESDDEFDGFTAAELEDAQNNVDALHGLTAAELDGAEKLLETSRQGLKEWFTMDNNCPVFEHVSDAEIIANVTDAKSTGNDTDDDVTGVDDTSEPCDPPPQVKGAIEGLETGLSWLETQEIDYVKVLQLRGLLDFARSKRDQGMRQMTLDHFFSVK